MVVLFSSRYNNLQLAPVAGPTNIWSNLPPLPPTKGMTSQETLPSSARRCGLNSKASAAMARISEAINQPRKRPEIAARALRASAARCRGTKYSLMDKTSTDACWNPLNQTKQKEMKETNTSSRCIALTHFRYHDASIMLQFPHVQLVASPTPNLHLLKQPETRIAILHRNLACVPFWNAEVVDAKVQDFLVQYRHLDRGLSSWLDGWWATPGGVQLEKHGKNHWKMSF